MPIWQSMSRIRQKLDIQYVARLQTSQRARHFGRIESVGRRRRIGALYAMRAIGTSCPTDWRVDRMEPPSLCRAQSVCPIHRAISILFEDDAVLFETRTRTTAALSVRCFKRTSAALCEVTVFVAHAASASAHPDSAGARSVLRAAAGRGRPRCSAWVPGIGSRQAVGAPAGFGRVRDWVGRRRRAVVEPSISVPESRRECEDLRARDSGFAKTTNERKKRKRLSTSIVVLCVFVTEKAASAPAVPHRLK